MLHGLGASLVVSRLLHGIALSYTEKWFFGRFFGTLLTFILLLAAGGLCIWQGIAAL